MFPREEQKTQKRFVKAIAYKFPIEQKVLTQFDECGASVETVVQLVRKIPDTYIDITVDMDELDLTSSEARATYEEIKDYIFERFGLKVSSLNIAQVKTKCGITERENYNKPKSENTKQPQCTKDKEEAIMNALRHFKMI